MALKVASRRLLKGCAPVGTITCTNFAAIATIEAGSSDSGGVNGGSGAGTAAGGTGVVQVTLKVASRRLLNGCRPLSGAIIATIVTTGTGGSGKY